MGFELSKAEKTIAAATVLAVSVFYFAFSKISQHSISTDDVFVGDSKINYKMARPEQAYSEYSIEGRDIDHRYEGLPEAQKKSRFDNPDSKVNSGGTTKVGTPVANNKVDAKKTDDKTKAAKTKAQQQQLQAQKSRAQAAKKQQELAKAQQEKLYKESLERSRQNAENKSPKEEPVQNQVVQNQPASQPNVDENQKPKGKTYAEWKALIFAQPTTENLSLFITAYRKSEVSQTQLHTMAQELLLQEDPKMKGLALMLIRSVPSTASLTQLVLAEPTLPQVYQDYVEQSYVAYFYPQNVVYLGSALVSKDRKVVARVLSLLSTNLTKLSQGDQSVFSDPRSSRGGSATPTTVNMRSFVSLVPSLTSIASTQDPELMPMAQQVVALIQQANSNNSVAQNN